MMIKKLNEYEEENENEAEDDNDEEFNNAWRSLQSRHRCEFAHRAHKMSDYKKKVLKK